MKDWVKTITDYYLIFDIHICPLYQKIGLIKRKKTVEELTSGLIKERALNIIQNLEETS